MDFNSTSTQDVPPSDGIGDTAYIIDADTKDEYPLIAPFITEIVLNKGWNLVSIPYIQDDTDLDKVLESIENSYDIVEWFNISDASGHWKINHTTKPPDMNVLYEITHTMGFWIHIIEPDTVPLRLPGTPPRKNQSISLHPGWNLVGYPSMNNKNRTAALNNLTFGVHVNSIWTYNAFTQKWEELNEPEDYFQIGRGYWIHAKTECVWEVPL